MGNSRLPLTDDEIVISKYNYDNFVKYGYKDIDNPTIEVKISNIDQILGKQISFDYTRKYTIVGVIDTHIDLSRFEKLKEESDNFLVSYLLAQEYEVLRMYSHHNVIFVREGYINRNKVEYGLDLYDYYEKYFSFTYDDVDYYLNYLNKTSKLDSNEVVFFSGKNINNMGKKDVVVSRQTMRSLIYNLDENYYTAVAENVRTYVESLTNAQLEGLIRGFESTFGNFADLTPAEKENYYNDVYNYYYSSEYNEPNDFADAPREVYFEAYNTYYSNLTSFSSTFTVATYTDIILEEDISVNVVGVYKTYDDDYNAPSVVVLSDEFFDELIDQEIGDFKVLISAIDPKDTTTINKLIKAHYKEEGDVFRYNNQITMTLASVNDFIESLSVVFLYIGIAFAVFSSLLLMNYISTSVSYKKKEIGILRAIGARGRDVMGIFTKESTIIALINFALALTGVIIATIFINNKIRNDYGILITILQLGVRQIALMLAVTLGVGVISSALPVSRIARKRPIDAIREVW